ncbi:MAG: hypothetical protein ACR2KA_08240 [Opitutales bacterium]
MRPLLLILLLGLTGCATYVDRGPRVRVAVEEGDYETAATVAQNFAADEPKDALVWNLDAAAALRAQGKLKESAKILEQVEVAMRAEEERAGFSVSGATLAAFSSGYAEAYRPRPADRIYASTYQALNRLETSDLNGARVAMARLRFVQQAFGSGQLYVKPKADDKYDVAKASQDARTKEGLGMIEENLTTLASEGTYDDAFSHWLQGMFFLRLGQDPSDREKARKELLAATQLNGSNDAFRRDLKEAEAPASEGQGSIVYVVAETGMCPEWYQQRVDIPLFIVSSRVPYVSVALPAIRPSGLNYNLKLKLDARDVLVPLASRPDALIAKHFEAALPGIKAQAFTSAAVKATASYLINKSSEEAANRQNSGSGAVLWAIATKVGTAIYTVGTTKADLRNWSGLPARFSVARLDAKAGQKLTVVGHPEATLVLPAGKVLLVSLKSTQENQPVVLRCTPLVP